MRSNVNSLAVLWLACLCLLSSCATMPGSFEPPKVSMDSFRVLPTEGAAPRFEIKLRVTNPNTKALDIAGVSYSVALLGKELVHGVTNDVPRIEGYSDEVITLEAGLQLFQVMRLLAGLGTATTTTEAMEYKFSAKVDFNGFTPTQRIEETGEITLN